MLFTKIANVYRIIKLYDKMKGLMLNDNGNCAAGNKRGGLDIHVFLRNMNLLLVRDAKFFSATFSETEGSSRSGLRNADLQGLERAWVKVDSVIVERCALRAVPIYSKIQESGTFHPL